MNPFNDIEQTLAELTDSEKILLIGGKDRFHTAPVERLSIPSIRFLMGRMVSEASPIFLVSRLHVFLTVQIWVLLGISL